MSAGGPCRCSDLERVADHLQLIVEIVRHAAGEQAERLHLLRVRQRGRLLTRPAAARAGAAGREQPAAAGRRARAHRGGEQQRRRETQASTPPAIAVSGAAARRNPGASASHESATSNAAATVSVSARPTHKPGPGSRVLPLIVVFMTPPDRESRDSRRSSRLSAGGATYLNSNVTQVATCRPLASAGGAVASGQRAAGGVRSARAICRSRRAAARIARRGAAAGNAADARARARSSGSPRASRACARPTINRLSRVSASAASLTGAPWKACDTARSSSARLAAVGWVMTAGAPGCAGQPRHAGSVASASTNSVARRGAREPLAQARFS